MTLRDEELQKLCHDGDSEAENVLTERYGYLVRACARPYFLAGGESEDLTQEGMMGLISAIRTYDASQNTAFRTYAEVCIRRRIYSAIRSASRSKHIPLNDGVSYQDYVSYPENVGYMADGSDETAEDGNSESKAGRATFVSQPRRMPEEQLLARESMTDFFHTFARYLSPMEQQILPLFLEGMSYRDIAEHCGRNVKSVDNAVQRIRRKLARQINPGDFSES